MTLPGLPHLVSAFGLSDFERDVVALCAAAELSPERTFGEDPYPTPRGVVAELANRCPSPGGSPPESWPSPWGGVGVGSTALGLPFVPKQGEAKTPPNPHPTLPQGEGYDPVGGPSDEDRHTQTSVPLWGALTPAAMLRKLRLLDVVEGPSFAASRLRLPERVFHFLLGHSYVDAPVDLVPPTELVPSHARIAQSIRWDTPTVLVGANVAPVAAGAGLPLYAIKASAVGDVRSFIDLWSREALLLSAALLVEADVPEVAREIARLAAFPLAVASPDDLRLKNARSFEVNLPTAREGEAVWRRELGARGAAMNGELRLLAGQFRLSPDEIRQVSQEEGLWEGARRKARQALEGLAQRIESRSGWDDLVLPDAQTGTLRQIVAHVRQRSRVYDEWGFAGRSDRGLGISALFAGPSGTGKTLAAEVVAGSLGLDLYRIDLSGVVSKYIGETEKNLRRIFEAAEGSGAVLFFDEADALFGKRSEVKDSHDRYANIEVSYLLQKMEAYSGLVVLTTNLKGNLDPAFVRRLRFIVQFPFPEIEDRRRIWEVAFPPQAPLDSLDFDRLAGLSLSGGSIRNVALNAAFLAAEEGSAVGMDHLRAAARGEFAKLERPMTEVSL